MRYFTIAARKNKVIKKQGNQETGKDLKGSEKVAKDLKRSVKT